MIKNDDYILKLREDYVSFYGFWTLVVETSQKNCSEYVCYIAEV